MKSFRSTYTSAMGSVTAACVAGGVTAGPQPVATAPAIDRRYGVIGRSSCSVSASQRTPNSIWLLGGMFWRLRISRSAPSTAWKRANWDSISAFCRAVSA